MLTWLPVKNDIVQLRNELCWFHGNADDRICALQYAFMISEIEMGI